MATIRELLVEYNSLRQRPGVRVGHAEILSSWRKPKVNLEFLVAQLRREAYQGEGGKRLTIGSLAEAVLVEVVDVDGNGNNLGHSYEEILRRVRVYFPNAETTPRSLAWYASKMRCAGVHVPFRPRAKAVRS